MSRHAALVLVLATGGCLFDGCAGDEPRVDGSDCGHDDDCESGLCRGGMCTASSCNVDGNCEEGFRCDQAPTWLEVLSFGTAKGVCLPSCDVCPWEENPRWTCSGNTCGYDGSPHLDAGGPYEAIVGEPVQLEVAIELDEGRSVETIEWTFNGVAFASERTAELVVDMAGSFAVNVTVTDDAYGIAYGTAVVDVCIEQGDPCGYGGPCCAGLQCSSVGTCD